MRPSRRDVAALDALAVADEPGLKVRVIRLPTEAVADVERHARRADVGVRADGDAGGDRTDERVFVRRRRRVVDAAEVEFLSSDVVLERRRARTEIRRILTISRVRRQRGREINEFARSVVGARARETSET